MDRLRPALSGAVRPRHRPLPVAGRAELPPAPRDASAGAAAVALAGAALDGLVLAVGRDRDPGLDRLGVPGEVVGQLGGGGSLAPEAYRSVE